MMFSHMLSSSKANQTRMEMPMLKNPKAKRMMEEAMELAGKALKIEEGKQRCVFCQLDVLGGNLVEHYTSHYSLEQPGMLVKVLVAKNYQASLRCPLNTCDNREMAVAELDLHIATEHDILKAVLEEDTRIDEKEVLKNIFQWEEKVVVWPFREDKSESWLDPKEMLIVDTEKVEADNSEAESNDHCEDGEIEDDDSEDAEEAENSKDDLERMFQDATSVDKSKRTNDKDEEMQQTNSFFGDIDSAYSHEIGGFEKESMNIKTEPTPEGKRLKEETISEALREISRGVPSRVAAQKFGLSRNLLARRVKLQDTRGWSKRPPGRQSRVMSREEESQFAECLRNRFFVFVFPIVECLRNRFNATTKDQMLEWATLRSLLQRHLQNMVEASPSRFTGFEATNQLPSYKYCRRFVQVHRQDLF